MKSSKTALPLPEKLPRHIAFIMDGNGRWAKKRLLPRKAGHRAGVKVMRNIVDECFTLGIPYVTVYAFSTENHNRPQEEIDALFALLKEYFSEFFDDLMKKNIRVLTIGDLSYFPNDLQEDIRTAVLKSAQNTRGTFSIALNYGGRDDILQAVNQAVKGGQTVTTEEFQKFLYTADLPDPDAIVRTGGEKRISNFLLYQCAYSELFFTDTLWPDFDKKELLRIISEYGARDRRYGKVKS